MLQSESLKSLVRMVLLTRTIEIGCDQCMLLIDEYIDLELAGKDAAQALPLVKAHLDLCPPCRLEYEALLIAVKSSTVL